MTITKREITTNNTNNSNSNNTTTNSRTCIPFTKEDRFLLLVPRSSPRRVSRRPRILVLPPARTRLLTTLTRWERFVMIVLLAVTVMLFLSLWKIMKMMNVVDLTRQRRMMMKMMMLGTVSFSSSPVAFRTLSGYNQTIITNSSSSSSNNSLLRRRQQQQQLGLSPDQVRKIMNQQRLEVEQKLRAASSNAHDNESMLFVSSPNHNNNNDNNSKNLDAATVQRILETQQSGRFIIFDAKLSGQGIGNIITGLLAAHLLAEEFNRTVCIIPRDFGSFHRSFESIDPKVIQHCPDVVRFPPALTWYNSVRVLNFGSPVDECRLKYVMGPQGPNILFFQGNTYPRWRHVPDHYFFQYYRPTPELLAGLPYNANANHHHHAPPDTVVHLRAPDDPHRDVRPGLDTESLRALGDTLPTATFLVTNRVDWYDWFERNYGWSHPPWNIVVHSALNQHWGERRAAAPPNEASEAVEPQEAMEPDVTKQLDSLEQQRQMWADWYTLLTAKTVYHTHSDFSASAVHWMNNHRHSKVIQGFNATTGQLMVRDEVWYSEGTLPPLVARTNGTTKESLQNCQEGILKTLGIHADPGVIGAVGVRSVIIRKGQKVYDSGR